MSDPNDIKHPNYPFPPPPPLGWPNAARWDGPNTQSKRPVDQPRHVTTAADVNPVDPENQI